MNLFDKSGGYRKLDSFTLATIIQLGTIRFCEKKFASRVDSPDSLVAANALHILVQRAIKVLLKQKEAQGRMFAEQGGFRERLTAVRLEARAARSDQTADDAPSCPLCGKPMRQRTAKSGRNAGLPFWGCTAYPECKGVREVGPTAAPPPPPEQV